MDISLRDWFAGQALAGLCAHSGQGHIETDVNLAYEYANAMLRKHEQWLAEEMIDKMNRRRGGEG